MQLRRMNSLQMPQLPAHLSTLLSGFCSLPGIHRQLGGLPHLQAGSLVQGYPFPILPYFTSVGGKSAAAC